MTFSIILPTHNRKERLRLVLAALTRQTLPAMEFEVVVVDDGSTDGTAKTLGEQEFPFALKVLTQPNAGPGAARNAGVAVAQGAILAFCEDDAIPDPDWLENAAARISSGERVDVLEGKTVYESTRNPVRRNDLPGVASFIPCNLFVRKEMFVKSGGYDPAFYDVRHHRYFREDADLGFRLLDCGAAVKIDERLLVSHPEQFHTLRDASNHVRRYIFDPLLYRKHPSRFRTMIEQKRILGIRVRRIQHLLALLQLAAFAALGCFLLAGAGQGTLLTVLAIVCLGFLFQWKYQGRRSLRRPWELPGFIILPLRYLFVITVGCIRYKSAGALIP